MGIGKSTALLSTTHSWLTTLKECKEIGAVFLDLQKAFESVPHKSLTETLQQTGISHHIISWISDYLTSRELEVVVDGKSSQFSPVISGVPQGSVLGPLLFLVYVDDLAQLSLSCGGQMVFCADDLLPFRTVSGNEDFLHFHHDISLIENWVKCNHLTLNSNIWLFLERGTHPCLKLQLLEAQT